MHAFSPLEVTGWLPELLSATVWGGSSSSCALTQRWSSDMAHSEFQVTEGARTLGWSLRKYLMALKDAGLGSLPGTAAEVLDDETRAIICPDKLSTAQWLEVHLQHCLC